MTSATPKLREGIAGRARCGRRLMPILIVAVAGILSSRAAGSLDDEIAAASQAIRPALAEASDLCVRGQYEEADARIERVFPAATRSAAQSLVLGNVLFKMQPKLSYALHREAAKALPQHANALLEWALQQHRAKDYAGAARTYAEFSKLQPDYAPALGLAAECALRTGDAAGAAALWKASERARRGTLVQLESLVCELNGDFPGELTRRDLLRRVASKDERAAVELLLLDSAWRSDWWNIGPRPPHLAYDQEVVNRIFPAPGAQLRAALCVAECELLQNKSGVRTVLARRVFFLDEKATLPAGGAALSHLFRLALEHRVFDQAAARERFGERVLALARESGDAETYNIAAHLALGSPRLAEIDQEGWDKTGDARFAASRIVGLARQNDFAYADPRLQRALKEFPENSEIAAVAVALAAASGDNAVLRACLLNAIKAEYTKFSSRRPGVDLPRPSAHVLRGYFAALERIAGK